MADANSSKRKWLAGTALPGALAATLLATVPPDWTWLIIALWPNLSTVLLVHEGAGVFQLQ